MVLERVLRRDDEERIGQRMGRPVERHLLLFHRLQQRALRTRRGAVDLVGEQHVAEDRTRSEAKRLGR